jgi:pimeloyl-ACP methyl ester carboxylesterase
MQSNKSAAYGTMQRMPTMQILGVNLEVQRIAGDAALAPIVFLHEGLGSVAMWRDYPKQVCAATGRAGLVYSRRGYGQSDAVPAVRSPSHMRNGQHAGHLLPDYMHHEAWTVLPELLAQCGIDKPVLLGHSDGASIALLYASRYATSACIAMAPHLFVEDVSLRGIAAARVAYETTDLRSKLARFHADVDCAFWQWNDVWLSDGFRSFDIVADGAQINCPLLGIQGYDDAYGTMAQLDALDSNYLNKKVLQPNRILREQLLKIEQCGHAPHKDQGAVVTGAVVQFLSTLNV